MSPGAVPAVRESALLLAVALSVAGFGCMGGPGNGTGARGASLGGFGPAVTTPIADVTANVFDLELGLVEETRWLRKTVTLSEEAFRGLARRGSRPPP